MHIQQAGRIGACMVKPVYLDIQQPQIRIRARVPDLELDIRPPSTEVQVISPRITVDMRQQWSELGLADSRTLTEDMAAEGRGTVLSGIKRIASEGDRLAAETDRGRAIADIARESMEMMTEITLVSAPSCPPDIEVSPRRKVSVKYSPGSVAVISEAARVDVHLLRGRVSVLTGRVRTGNKIDIQG